jgi:hypothetical protein
MNLEDLTLHPRSLQMAKNLAANLPQGLIIDGPVGSGVLSVAKALARMVGSPEFIVRPKKKLKNEFVVDLSDGSVVIEDIRLLYEQTRTRQPGEHVYIIDTGQKSMTHGAGNAFLKLLEEPRPGLHFIIVTHHFEQLLPTIISRSQRLSLLPITDEQTAGIIDDLGIEDPTKRTRLAFVGRGLPALIKRLADDEAYYAARVTIMRDAKTMLGLDTYAKLVVVNSYRENRADALTLLDDMNHQLRTVLKTNANPRLVEQISQNLDVRGRLSAGGNVRLHLSTAVL